MAYRENKQHRLYGYDYSQNGAYFITICTKNRTHYFGQIKDKTVILSEIGELAKTALLQIPEVYPQATIEEWIIMPNHIHLIIAIQNTEISKEYHSVIGLQPLVKGSISSIINHFKGKVTKLCKQNKYEFVWQSRFHDHIIRNEEAFNKISEYILNNPANWDNDQDNLENLYM